MVPHVTTYEVAADTVVKTFYITPNVDGPARVGISRDGGEIVDEVGKRGIPFSYDFNGLFQDRTVLYLSGNFQIKFKTENYA
jgi:hypothetical protein